MTDLRAFVGEVHFFKTWELQKRGMLHLHAMMRATTVTDRRFRAAVRLCARRYGFGREVDVQSVDMTDERAVARRAGYCAKYVTKASDSLPAVLRLNVITGELIEGGYRPWSASRQWGDTMRMTKLRRRLWAVGAPPGAPAAGDEVALDQYQEIYGADLVGVLGIEPCGDSIAV